MCTRVCFLWWCTNDCTTRSTPALSCDDARYASQTSGWGTFTSWSAPFMASLRAYSMPAPVDGNPGQKALQNATDRAAAFLANHHEYTAVVNFIVDDYPYDCGEYPYAKFFPAYHAFLDDPDVRLIGYEAGGDGVETGRHAATFSGGTPGAFQGSYSYVMQNADGQTIESHSISAGLDYPGVGPEHAFLKEAGRTEYRPITDTEAMNAFRLLCKLEGIIPAIETAHAIAGVVDLAAELGPESIILINLSGRGDKDVETAARWFDLFDGAKPGPS
jgi:hypothetical protein